MYAVRRRAAAKKKKLKNLGKSKSTDTEEEEGEDDQDDGELYFTNPTFIKYSLLLVHLSCDFFSECSNKRKIVKSRPSSSSKRFHDFSVVRTYVDQRFPKEIVIILREVMEKLN